MPAPTERRARGDAAEAAACRLLEENGLRLVARNAGFKVGELDLVMADGDGLAFVEVRFRATSAFGDGLDSITRGKRRRIARAAQAWLQRHPALAERPCRFDVVAVAQDATGLRCDWLRGAFTLDDC